MEIVGYEVVEARIPESKDSRNVKNENKLPPWERYLGNYMSLNYAVGLLYQNSLVIKQCEKTYQVWYVRKIVKEEKEEIIGYRLKRFNKDNVIEMLYYMEKLVADKGSKLEYSKCNTTYKYHPLDIVYKASELQFRL